MLCDIVICRTEGAGTALVEAGRGLESNKRPGHSSETARRRSSPVAGCPIGAGLSGLVQAGARRRDGARGQPLCSQRFCIPVPCSLRKWCYQRSGVIS